MYTYVFMAYCYKFYYKKLTQNACACTVKVMTIGNSYVETEQGLIYPAFPTVPIGTRFEIVVASLVRKEAPSQQPHDMFSFKAVRNPYGRSAFRLVGACAAGKECEAPDAYLQEPCNYFVPSAGRRLFDAYMPFVAAHTFGVDGLLDPAVKELCSEVFSNPLVGKIMPRVSIEQVA